MVARDSQIFTTDEVTCLVGLKPQDTWRIIKFAEGSDYGIAPSVKKAAGSGTRRLYNLENVCQITLALRLLETGLRSKAIGKVIRQLREKEELSSRLEQNSKGLLLAIVRTPKIGQPLDERRQQLVEWVSGAEEADCIRRKGGLERDLILIPVGLLLSELSQRLKVPCNLTKRRKRTKVLTVISELTLGGSVPDV